jgi:hypothetical protein
VRADRTVTVQTWDQGPVTTPEPEWCTGEHEDGLHLVDLVHDGPDISLTVDTEAGPVELLHLLLTQYPYATRPEARALYMAVNLEGGYRPFRDDIALYRLADQLVENAVQLRAIARQLAELRIAEDDSANSQ